MNETGSRREQYIACYPYEEYEDNPLHVCACLCVRKIISVAPQAQHAAYMCPGETVTEGHEIVI